MSTKPGIPDHFTIHDVREHVARIFPDSATAAHHAADTDDETLRARAVRDIRGASPLLAQALDLLRHARPWITDDAWSANEPPATMTRAQVAALRAEIDAFLAGMPIVSEGSSVSCEPPAGACVRITWAETAKGMRALLAQGMPPADVLAMYLGTETPGLRPSSK